MGKDRYRYRKGYLFFWKKIWLEVKIGVGKQLGKIIDKVVV